MEITLKIEAHEASRYLGQFAFIISKINDDWEELEKNIESIVKKIKTDPK